MQFYLLFPWIPVDIHSLTIVHETSSHSYVLTGISGINGQDSVSHRSIHTGAAWLCLDTHPSTFPIQVHPTAPGTTASFLCPAHQPKLFCCLSAACSRQMVILRHCSISAWTPAELSQHSKAWLAPSPGSPRSPRGCSLLQGTVPSALALGVNQEKHTHFIKATYTASEIMKRRHKFNASSWKIE